MYLYKEIVWGCSYVSKLMFIGLFMVHNNVQCAMYSVQCTVYNIQCTMYSVQ